MSRTAAALAAALSLVASGVLAARAPLASRPAATLDLRSSDGAAAAGASWLYAPATLVTVDARAAGADLKASGDPVQATDLSPRGDRLDDAGITWTHVAPESLQDRRGTGLLSFGWYRTSLTIPARVAQVDVAGTTAVLEIVVDDYAEVWVDGRLPRALGRSGGPLIAGFNAPNRVVLTRDARPGQRFDIAVLAVNGPMSAPPANFLWIRSASLDFFTGAGSALESVPLEIVRKDPAMDAIVAPGTVAEKLAEGFSFAEGPVWADGALLFSDPNDNTIFRWSEDEGVSVFRVKSGYSGADIGRLRQPGSNGLAFDAQGRLTICEHGNRRVTRLEKNGVLTVLADRCDGKRLNSPNDLVYKSDGSLYFTDPPFGLPAFHADPQKELPYEGVMRVVDGRVEVLAKDLRGPNGLAFSPDERFLYVANWDEKRRIVMRYPVLADGRLGDGSVFFDVGDAAGAEALDGLKVDAQGDVLFSGPGGVWVIAPDGRHLGTLRLPELPANLAWGDADRRTLYLTARTGLYRVRLLVKGAGH